MLLFPERLSLRLGFYLFFLCFLLIGCGKPSPWFVYDSTNTSLETNLIRQISLNQDSLEWIGTYGKGLYRKSETRFEKVSQGFQGEYVLSLKSDEKGLWVGTAREGLFRYQGHTWSHLDTASGLCGNNVWEIFLDVPDKIYLGSRYQGLSLLDEDSVFCDAALSKIAGGGITAITRDGQGWLWFGSVSRGLLGLHDNDTLRFYRGKGLSGNFVRALVCHSTVQYVATWDGGLDVYDGREWRKEAIVPSPAVALAEGPDSSLWVGTWGFGVFVRHHGQWRCFSAENSGLPDNHVIDIKFGTNGMTYLATNKGIARYNGLVNQ